MVFFLLYFCIISCTIAVVVVAEHTVAVGSHCLSAAMASCDRCCSISPRLPRSSSTGAAAKSSFSVLSSACGCRCTICFGTP